MPLDPSIFQNAGPKPIDIGSLIEMARGKQRLDAESSMGDIFAGAANDDGSINTGKLATATNLRRAGPYAANLAQQSQALQQGQNTIDHGKLDNYRSWLDVLEPKLYSMINDPELNARKVREAVHSLVGHKGSSHLEGGMFGAGLAVRANAMTYGPNGQDLDANGLRKILGQLHTQVLGHLDASEPIATYVDPTNGRRTTLTRAGAIAADAATPRPRPGAASGGAPGIPGAQIAPGGGVGYQTEPPVGFEQAGTAIGAASGGSANRLTEANDTSQVRRGMLGNLEDDLEKFTSGPTADWTRVGKAWVNRNVPLPENWKFDPQSIASQEQFNKQATMLAQSQFAAIGGTGTDAKFESAFATSPNETLSKLGNKGIIRLLKGNEDAIQAKNAAWRKWIRAGHGPQTYADFSEEFNSHFDPRAFQFKYVPKAEQQAYINQMDPEERQRFKSDIDYARAQGWVRF